MSYIYHKRAIGARVREGDQHRSTRPHEPLTVELFEAFNYGRYPVDNPTSFFGVPLLRCSMDCDPCNGEGSTSAGLNQEIRLSTPWSPALATANARRLRNCSCEQMKARCTRGRAVFDYLRVVTMTKARRPHLLHLLRCCACATLLRDVNNLFCTSARPSRTAAVIKGLADLG